MPNLRGASPGRSGRGRSSGAAAMSEAEGESAREHGGAVGTGRGDDESQ